MLGRQQIRLDRFARRRSCRKAVTAGDFAQHDAALGIVGRDPLQSGGDFDFTGAHQLGDLLDRKRLASNEQHRLDRDPQIAVYGVSLAFVVG